LSPTGSEPGGASHATPCSAGSLPPPHTRGTRRGASLSGRRSASGIAQAGVEHVPYRVAEQVEAHHGEEDRDAREDRHPRRPEELSEAVADHQAPLRLRGLGAQAEEAEDRKSTRLNSSHVKS